MITPFFIFVMSISHELMFLNPLNDLIHYLNVDITFTIPQVYHE